MREALFPIFSAIIGAIIGSFLNACIHRLPRDLSIGEPKRSFCPSCNRTIPWYENLPVISWIWLRGKCSGCGAKISVRYLVVEVLTAALFYFAWVNFGLPLAPVYWLFLALLVTATFIDIEHFIIPDVITWGGTVAGIVLSVAVPQMMGTPSRLESFGLSVGGAALGFGMLWLIVEFGKLAFGRKRHAFKEDVDFIWKREEDTALLTIGDESLPWHDIGFREKDLLVMESVSVVMIDGVALETDTLKFRYNVLLADGKEWELDKIDIITGKLQAVVIPREAMGFGDVKFIAAIGAFLGWQSVLFTICSASIIGCVAALAGIFMAKDRSGSRVPFGPFLALGAAWWIFGGQRVWEWYFGLFNSRGLEF